MSFLASISHKASNSSRAVNLVNMTSLLKQPTIHVGNLCTSTPKRQLKEALFYRFARYGTVIDVVVMKRQKRLRGQAWVVFLQVNAAAVCIQDAQGKLLLGRKMKLAYAKKKSNATAERDGTWVAPHSRPKDTGADGQGEISVNKERPQQEGTSNESTSSTLVIHDLPENATVEAMTALFGQFAQFLSVKKIDNDDNEDDGEMDAKKDEKDEQNTMHVEFGTSNAANVAYRNLNGFRLTPTDVLEMEFL